MKGKKFELNKPENFYVLCNLEVTYYWDFFEFMYSWEQVLSRLQKPGIYLNNKNRVIQELNGYLTFFLTTQMRL